MVAVCRRAGAAGVPLRLLRIFEPKTRLSSSWPFVGNLAWGPTLPTRFAVCGNSCVASKFWPVYDGPPFYYGAPYHFFSTRRRNRRVVFFKIEGNEKQYPVQDEYPRYTGIYGSGKIFSKRVTVFFPLSPWPPPSATTEMRAMQREAFRAAAVAMAACKPHFRVFLSRRIGGEHVRQFISHHRQWQKSLLLPKRKRATLSSSPTAPNMVCTPPPCQQPLSSYAYIIT